MKYLSSYGRLIIGAVVLTTPIMALQQLTIPEWLAKAGESLRRVSQVPSGVPPAVAEVLDQTDVIVAGTLGEPHSYLSEDQREVYTDYPILGSTIMFESVPRVSRPGASPSITVTLLGGKIISAGLSYESIHYGLPLPQAGTECLLLVKQIGNRYFVAGRYLGVFRTTNNKVAPLTGVEGFAAEYHSVTATEMATDVVAKIRVRRAR
jgi:hypothetical protein